ncbi:hypothetical protein GCM10017764_35660 [Sphingobacterium griseoflavum]|uniref:Uncharacterized protein n=1 Tax=Sphingobacterium griseoflavum TaxID=1474952 RepID=A0ABQ3HZ45_9SPHI|nr:hypothetical protein GCM10017764_35660 [Sphingobacterium griseoflavum]
MMHGSRIEIGKAEGSIFYTKNISIFVREIDQLSAEWSIADKPDNVYSFDYRARII